MRKIANTCVLLALFAVGGNALSQEVFTGKVVYRHKLTNPKADYPVVDSTVLSCTRDLALVERYYGGPVDWSYPAMEVVTINERLQGYSNNWEVVFTSSGESLGTEVVSVEKAGPVLGHACKRVVTKKLLPTGAYLKRNYLVADKIPRNGVAALFPGELAGMPLACEIIYEDKQGNYLFSEIIEAVRVETSIDEALVKRKAEALGARKRTEMKRQNFKKELGVSAGLSTAIECE